MLSSGYSTRVSVLAAEAPDQRADEITAAEFLEVEIIGCSRRPQPQRVDGFAAIADHRPVEGHADQGRGPPRDKFKAAAVHLERAD